MHHYLMERSVIERVECCAMESNIGDWTGMAFDVMQQTVFNRVEVNRAFFAGMVCKRTLWNVLK